MSSRNKQFHTPYMRIWRKKKQRENINYPLKQLRYLFGFNYRLFLAFTIKRKKYSKENCKKYNWKTKWDLFEILGNKCAFCGETTLDVLQIHHLGEKNGYHWREYRLEYFDNSQSIVLLCANCHILIHKGLIPLEAKT